MQQFFGYAIRSGLARIVSAAMILSVCSTAQAQLDFERDPINYGKTPARAAAADLQGKLDAGQVQLTFDEEHGYLKSVLESLGIKPSSQVLVHSQTSFQLRRISPRRPRTARPSSKFSPIPSPNSGTNSAECLPVSCYNRGRLEVRLRPFRRTYGVWFAHSG